MKKTVLLFMTFFTLSTITFASFPIVGVESTEFVNNTQSESNDPDSKKIGILLGVTLGIFGVLIAYLMDDDEMVKWAWKGFFWSMIIALILVLLSFMFLLRVDWGNVPY